MDRLGVFAAPQAWALAKVLFERSTENVDVVVTTLLADVLNGALSGPQKVFSPLKPIVSDVLAEALACPFFKFRPQVTLGAVQLLGQLAEGEGAV